ncbi:MAG: hypothetical protein FWC27_08955, partial [Firmicutes bacterium]|nr:hypothetical protein [Bacillota bacterium]
VTAVAPGTAAVTVTTADGGKTATCAVTVAIPADPAIPVKANEFTVHGSENEEDNYAFVAAIDLGDFEHPQMVWQPGSVKLSEILPSSFNTAGLTVTAVPETLNGYVSIGQDWKNDPALLITYYGTKAQWEAAIANLTTPAVQMTLVLHKAGYQDAAIKVNLSFEGSNIS